jgi:hypothetical protein
LSNTEQDQVISYQSHQSELTLFFPSFDFNYDWSILPTQTKLKTLDVYFAQFTDLPYLLTSASESSSIKDIRLVFELFTTVYIDRNITDYSNPNRTFSPYIKNLILSLGDNSELEKLEITVVLSKVTAAEKADYKELENDYKALHPKTKTTIQAVNYNPSGGMW